MEADFSGYATKAGLKCTDGRTIMPDAFKHQDQVRVPLVWQHGHNDPENVLGHVLLENREDGMYCYGFFNDSAKAKHSKGAVAHKDITMLSIWANDLIERSKQVLHGAIREVSLVLSGANPGALIENVTIRHSNGEDMTTLDDEAIIFTGLAFEHSDGGASNNGGGGGSDKGQTPQEIYDAMTAEQKSVVHQMVGDALDDEADHIRQAAGGGDETVQDVYDAMSDKQKMVVQFMIGQAVSDAGGSIQQDNLNDDGTQKGDQNEMMHHNVFEDKEKETVKERVHISHADLKGIMADATRTGSLRRAVTDYALSHGIEDIEILFPDAQAITNTPELFARRTAWVASLMGGIRKTPFANVKSLSADLTVQEARAKGYIKGTLKKEEFFKVSKRSTTPTTIYKKQKLDRDDMIDITDFDVVVWLKAEMRLMLDEEIARAILVGDGRAGDDEDKVDEERIRPIVSDHELYTTQVYVNIDDANSNMEEVLDQLALQRTNLRGTGLPNFYTTETYIARLLLIRDDMGRKIYKSLDELTTDMRVNSIVAVEVLEEYPDIVGIMVNPVDYNVGATAGGQVSMFDDFDIDYNQYKYLIETRFSGALVKLKSAMVVRRVAAADALVAPAAPAFDGTDVTIVDQAGVVYRNEATDAVMNAAGSPYAVAAGDTLTVVATPAAGYYFQSSENDSWDFTNPA